MKQEGAGTEKAQGRRLHTLMLCTRTACAVAAQALVAGIFALRSSPTPYLRLRRVVPLAIAHALLDGTSVFIGVLLPLLRA